MNNHHKKSEALLLESLYVMQGKQSVLWDLSFSIPRGLMVAIVGPNGAGKSTLLKAILGLVPSFSGSILLLGEEGKLSQSNIAYVPQKESIDWDFPITAEEMVLMGRYGKMGFFSRLTQADRQAAKQALFMVGMSSFAKRQIGELSGGQRQRLFIARALVQNSDLLLLDEPFAGVDLSTEKEIVDLLKKERDQGKTVFVVHHDLPTIKEYFDWVILLNQRLIAAGPVDEVFTEEAISQAFGKDHSLFCDATALSIQKKRGL